MVAQIGSLAFSLSVDTRGVASGVGRAATVTERGMGRITRSAGLAEVSVRRTNRALAQPLRPFSLIAASRAFDTTSARAQLLRGSMIALTGAFGGFTAALGANILLRYADSFTELRNQIRVVSKDAGDLAAQFEAVEDISVRSRSGLRETAILYSRLRKSAPTQSAQEILEFTETIQKSLQLGGATAQEAASAAIQFSQAIASNRLGGEELRAVLETPLGLELAKGLDITIGKFRELGKAGELTSDVLFGALKKQGPSVARQFNSSIRTFDQSVTIADTRFTSYIGKLNDSLGATQLLGGAVISLTDNLDQLVPVLGSVVGLLGAAFGGRLLSSPFTRAGDAFAALRTNAKTELKAAEQVVQASKAENTASRNALAGLLRAQRSGRTVDFADVELGKAAEQASARANKQLPQLDTKKLRLLEEEGRLRRNLAQISANLTPAQIRSSEILGREQARLNAALVQERLVRQQIRGAVTAQTSALGLQATTGVGGAAAAKAVREQTRLTKELGRVQATITKLTESSTARRIALNEAETAAYTKAVTARAAVLSKLDSVTGKLVRVDTQRDALSVASRTARTAARASGQENLGAQIGQGGLVVSRAGAGLADAESKLKRATKAALPLGRAVTAVKSAFLGLSAFLGGPFGVAIAVGIAGMLAIGAQSAKTAAAVERGTRRLQSTLEDLRTVGLAGEAGSAERALSQLRIVKQIEDARQAISDNRIVIDDELKKIERIFQNAANTNAPFTETAVSGNEGAEAVAKFRKAMEELRSTGSDPAVFLAELRQMASSSGVSTEAIDSVDKIATKLLAASLAQDVFNKKQKEGEAALREGRSDQDVTIGDDSGRQAVRALAEKFNQATNFDRDVAKLVVKLEKSLKTKGVLLGKGAVEQIKIAAGTRVLLKKIGSEVKRSVSDAKALTTDIFNFRRSFGDQAATQAARVQEVEAQRRKITELRAALDAAAVSADNFGNRFSAEDLFGFDSQKAGGLFSSLATQIDELSRKLISGLDQQRFSSELDRIVAEFKALGASSSVLEQIRRETTAIATQTAIWKRELRDAEANLQRIGAGNFLQQGSLTAQAVNVPGGGGSRDTKVTITRPTPREIGEGVANSGLLDGARDSVDGLSRLNDTERENLSAIISVRDSILAQTSAFDRQFASLRTSPDNLSDNFTGSFELLDKQTAQFQSAVTALEAERNVIQANLGLKDLTPEQVEQGELRIAEITLQIAKLQQAFAALPPTRTGSERTVTGGLKLTEFRPLSAEQREFEKLLGFASGGSFEVGGSGGIDSKLVQFKATPSETVTVLKRGEHQALLNAIGAGSGNGGGRGIDVSVVMNLNNVQDRDSFELAREQVAVEFATSVEQALAERMG